MGAHLNLVRVHSLDRRGVVPHPHLRLGGVAVLVALKVPLGLRVTQVVHPRHQEEHQGRHLQHGPEDSDGDVAHLHVEQGENSQRRAPPCHGRVTQ